MKMKFVVIFSAIAAMAYGCADIGDRMRRISQCQYAVAGEMRTNPCGAFSNFTTCARDVASGCPALLRQVEQSLTVARAQMGGACGGEDSSSESQATTAPPPSKCVLLVQSRLNKCQHLIARMQSKSRDKFCRNYLLMMSCVKDADRGCPKQQAYTRPLILGLQNVYSQQCVGGGKKNGGK